MAKATTRRATASRKPGRSGKDAVINLRVSGRTRDMIDAAAAALSKSRTDFILDVVQQWATDVILDQQLFHLDPRAFEKFIDLLDNPPPPAEGLKTLMREKSPWKT